MTTKTYTFKLDTKEDAQFIAAIERWRSVDHTIASMVKTLLARNEGLELPVPKDTAYFLREIRRIDETLRIAAATMAVFEAKQNEIIDIVSEMNQATAKTEIELVLDQLGSSLTTSEVATEGTSNHSSHHGQLLENQEAPILSLVNM